jgi:hypothetical protein
MNHRGAVLGVAMDSDDRGLAVGDGRMRQQRDEIAHQALAQLGPPVEQQRQILDELAGVGVGDDGQRRRPRGRLRRQPWPAARLSVPAHVGLGGDAEPCRARRAALPPRAPELLNGQENIWQFMRQNWLSNRVFKSFDDIVDHCCYAWNTLIDQPWKIMSIARRDWASLGYSM